MKTRFNLATAPLENNRRFVAGASAIGVLAIIAMVLLSLHAVRTRRTDREMRVQINTLHSQIRIAQQQQETLRNEFKSPEAIEALKRSAFLNGLIEARAFPWTKMFADLEQILPPGVRVISISPQMGENGHVRVVLSVGAVNDEQELKFLNSMDSSPVFSDVHVKEESHPGKAPQGGADTVLVNLEAYYSIT